jgi:plasmid maintenance system antidote protein VapI
VALSRILNGSAGISADMALKLADALGTSPELWIGMQTQYDLWQASQRRRKKVRPMFVGAGRHDTAVESHSSRSAR